MLTANLWHYDGRNGNRWEPRLIGDSEVFRLFGADWETGPWRWSDLEPVDAGGSDHVYGHRAEQGWRIGFADPLPPELAILLPKRAHYGGIIDRFGLIPASLVLGIGAALLVFAGLRAPGWIAPYVPQAWEDNLGDAMVGDFGGRFCHTKDGNAALRALVRQLDPEARARSIELAAIPMTNAVALPGRRIIIFDGLVQDARSPDEVAGVLGHELGHVAHRDTLTALMRQAGLSVLLGGFDGSGGAQLNALLGLSYGREAEHRADVAAIGALARADISPQPTADFFRRLGGDAKDETPAPEKSVERATNWLATHPSPASRRALFEQAAKASKSYRPALSAAQWRALRRMCEDDKEVEKGFRFGF